jgi:putative polyhydroxyalkanoate system protein
MDIPRAESHNGGHDAAIGTRMSAIEIQHRHSLPAPEARKAVEGVAVKLGEKFGLDYRWEGDTLHFVRSGIDGRITLAPQSLQVTAKLGFMLSALKGPIETEIRRVLAQKFA